MQTQSSETIVSAITDDSKANASSNMNRTLPNATEIQTWIVEYLAQLLEIDPEEVDATVPFDRYGLDSATAVGMTGDLEDWLGRTLDPTLLYDYPTVESFSRHLAEELSTAA